MKKQLSNLPRVVKFSGGRSSAVMLIRLLEEGKLKQKRGDVILFNNTSAEHKATYAFISRIKEIAETKFNIPFFLTEFRTYEVKNTQGKYVRRSSYQLVNEYPYSQENQNGYRFRGEVFEEMISYTGVLPNVHQRICTGNLKIFVSNAFLSDWFSMKKAIERQGHFASRAKISDEEIILRHKKARGQLTDKAIIGKKSYVRSCPHIREEQRFSDFTKADSRYQNNTLIPSIVNNKATLYGDCAVEFMSYIGIRFDERHRAVKVRERIKKAQNNKTSSLYSQPEGEIVKMPLIKHRMTKDKVLDACRKYLYDLDLPYNGLLSNCVFCPLKGKAKIKHIAKNYDTKDHTPSSIDWWYHIEEKYHRDLRASKQNDYTNIGFFGVSKYLSYNALKKEAKDSKELREDIKNDYMIFPCDCTD